jgi:hypothetical protein
MRPVVAPFLAPRGSTRASRIGGALLLAWFVAMLGLGAGLLARHMLPFRSPSKTEQLAASLDALRRADQKGSWLAVHVLYADCRCSKRVAEHLALGPRPPGWVELVLWVGDSGPDPLLEARFDVRRIAQGDLGHYGIESAPLLVLLDPDGNVHYAGGYTDRKQGPVIFDQRLFAAARVSPSVPSLPVYGCAVSRRLQDDLASLPTL